MILAVGGLGIKMLFDRKAQFTGGSCQVQSEELQAQEEELRAINEELHAHAEALRAQQAQRETR